MAIETKDLTLTQIDSHIRELEETITTLETQVHDYRAIISASTKTWKDMLRTEIIRMLVEKDDHIKNIGSDAEHVLIKTALEFNCNKRQETATILGYGRNTITKKVTELNIQL
jgi:two-component system, NtrC family, nitrogen regulation response regulator GlnG